MTGPSTVILSVAKNLLPRVENCKLYFSPRFLHVHHMLAVLRCNDETDADEWDVRFRIDGEIEDSNRFGIGIACRVVARGVLKFDGHATLKHQEEASAIVQMPGSRSTRRDFRGIHADAHTAIFGKLLVQFVEMHPARMHHARLKQAG